MAWNWSLFFRTVSAVVGLLAVLAGLTDLSLALRGEGGRVGLGLAVLALGAVLLGWPVGLGVRDALRARDRGET